MSHSTQRGFPTSVDKPLSANHKARFQGKVQGLSTEAITAITDLQPYELPAQERGDYALTVLHELNVTDKHRLLLVVAAAMNIVDLEIGTKGPGPGKIDRIDGDSFRASMALEDGAEVGSFTGNASAHVGLKTTFDIAFPQVETAQFKPVVPCLRQLRDFVVDVVDSFEVKFF